ncbi:Pentatricopeptide repeat-containing protein, mitochondrial [Vitis vinifera]|uniref:Pentatricopeptide repeat-containing protein, mitochondrial n=1 Tax=Vitis vinifera TaxID=29760 RepID=A0A438HPM5_VITVI|nr:Pentatricopeptide repeat-containing protein, mitochondrial [Vitis vinifera]
MDRRNPRRAEEVQRHFQRRLCGSAYLSLWEIRYVSTMRSRCSMKCRTRNASAPCCRSMPFLGLALILRSSIRLRGVFSELPSKLSVEPDLVSYNIVIKGLCDMGSMDSAVGMLDEMEKKSWSRIR